MKWQPGIFRYVYTHTCTFYWHGKVLLFQNVYLMLTKLNFFLWFQLQISLSKKNIYISTGVKCIRNNFCVCMCWRGSTRA